jgi:hypothetical protein
MKISKLLFMLLIIAAIGASCKKEGPAGPAGPAGTNGTNGANGTDGTNGTNGNANVTVYGFSGTTFTSAVPGIDLSLPLSVGMVDSSLILPYYSLYGYWYQVGVIGYATNFTSRYYIDPGITPDTTDLRIIIMDVDATPYSGANITCDSIRVFVIPANIFRSAGHQNIDFTDYNEVSAYYDRNRLLSE